MPPFKNKGQQHEKVAKADTSFPIEIWKSWPEELRFRAICEVVMRKHDSLGHPCGSRCIDQGAALPGSSFSGSLLNLPVIYVLTQAHESFPADNFAIFTGTFLHIVIENHYFLDFAVI